MQADLPLEPVDALKVGGQAALMPLLILLGQAEADLDPQDYARLKAQTERLSRLLAEVRPGAAVELVAPL